MWHLVGNNIGGGYERAGSGYLNGRNGITVMELDADSLSARVSSIWDSYNVSDDTTSALTELSVALVDKLVSMQGAGFWGT